MSKRQRIVVILVVGIVVGWAVYSIWSPFEPRYHGRRISSWLEDYPRHKQQDWREAEAAIRSFGTNGIPYIFKHIRKGDPFWRNAHARLWLRSPVWLKKTLGRPTFRNTFDIAYAPEAFALIGPVSIPPLIEALKDDHPKVRTAALLVLGGFGPEANTALPTLNDLLADAHSQPSLASMIRSTIRRIDPESVAKSAPE